MIEESIYKDTASGAPQGEFGEKLEGFAGNNAQR